MSAAAEVKIRAARPEDVDAVVALERAVAEAPHWAEGEYGAMVRGGTQGHLRRRLLVAERGGEIVGFGVGKVIDGIGAELESVAVAPRARRVGVGRALCEAVIAWSNEEGAGEVELEVRAESVAISLYERLGFKKTGVRRGYYRAPVGDAILMRLSCPKSGMEDVESSG